MIGFFHTVQSFVQNLWNWILSGGVLVDQNTANIRAEICVACHNNKPSGEVRKQCCGGGTAANIAIRTARATIIQDRTTPYDKNLLTCAICGCDNTISVWIPNDVLVSNEDANAYPTFCFKKKILEGHNV